MRIISQDGLCDYPYNASTIIAEEDCDKYFVFVYTTEQYGTRIAEYSSKEKAIKAMEMCRSSYYRCMTSLITSVAATDILSFAKGENVLGIISSRFAFQFPKDEEVEV